MKAGVQEVFAFRAETAQSVQVCTCEHGLSSWQTSAAGPGIQCWAAFALSVLGWMFTVLVKEAPSEAAVSWS